MKVVATSVILLLIVCVIAKYVMRNDEFAGEMMRLLKTIMISFTAILIVFHLLGTLDIIDFRLCIKGSGECNAPVISVLE